mmetsp:Transcript_3483/g.6668  ORF Transcript_3483/g.6668 Transcript_3483/m.6668 type:complete len:356 (-) Transcript_3483:482-1549(-)
MHMLPCVFRCKFVALRTAPSFVGSPSVELVHRFESLCRHLLSARPRSNPAHLHANQLFDALQVSLCGGRELLELRALADVGLPPVHRFVLHLDLAEAVKSRRHHPVRKHFSINLVFLANLDLIKAREDVKLRDVHGLVVVHHVPVLHYRDVKPTTPSGPSRCGSVFMPNVSHFLADIILELSRKRPRSNPCGVSLDHTDGGINLCRRNTKASAYPPCSGRRGSYVRVGSEINIQKSRIRALGQDRFSGADGRVNIMHRVNHHIFDLFLIGIQPVEFLFAVVIKLVHALKVVHQRVVLLIEVVFEEITNTKPVTVALGGVSWSNSFFRGANRSRSQGGFTQSVNDLMCVQDQVSTV